MDRQNPGVLKRLRAKNSGIKRGKCEEHKDFCVKEQDNINLRNQLTEEVEIWSKN